MEDRRISGGGEGEGDNALTVKFTQAPIRLTRRVRVETSLTP